MQGAFRNRHHIHTKDDGVNTFLPISRRIPLPEADVFRKWLCSRFAGHVNHSILVVNGTGEEWGAPKLDSVILTACQPDIRCMQIKTFHRILLLREIAREFSVNPCVYILTLPDRIITHDKGFDYKEAGEKAAETRSFLKEVFLAYSIVVETREDETEIERAMPTILEFEALLREILDQMRTPDELEKTESFGEKRTALTRTEKRLLRIYLFQRKMSEVLSSTIYRPEEQPWRCSFISSGLQAQTELGISYNIYDESNAGAAILRKLVSIEKGREYPGTIVLPDPMATSGQPMRYQVQQRDLRINDALFLSDSYVDLKRKLVDEKNVSNGFLDYLIRNIIRPFAPRCRKKEIDLLATLNAIASYNRKRQLVLKYYWEIIKPYYSVVERITGLHEGLFIPEGLRKKAIMTLGSTPRNMTILQTIATYYENNKDSITANELYRIMGLSKTAKRSLYRNLRKLTECGLVVTTPQGERLKTYSIPGHSKYIHLDLPLTKPHEKPKVEEMNIASE